VNPLLVLSIALTIIADTAYAVIVGTFLAGRWLDAADSVPAARPLAPRGRRKLLLVCVAAYIVVHLLRPWFLAVSMSGSNDFSSDLALVPTILSSTHQGKLWFITSAAIALLLIGTLAIASNAKRAAGWVIFIALIVIAFTKAASGHAADDGDFTLNEFSMFLHIVATAVWSGSVLVGGFLVLPRLVRDTTHDTFWNFGSRLSGSVTWALGGLLVSGIYTADRELNNTLHALWSSAWGKVLITKVSFVLIAITLGAMSRFLCLGRSPEPARAALMVRLMTTEAAVMVCILFLSGLLGSTAPAMSIA
jgi:putative copper resistance protein D